MEIDLSLHGRRLHSIFELLGTKENDITYSVGWALAQSEQFRTALVRRLFPQSKTAAIATIDLQARNSEPGVTDIELIGPDLHVIVEAKRGVTLPTDQQLSMYAPRLKQKHCRHTALVTMSECTSEYAGIRLPKQVEGIPVAHLSWKDVAILTRVKKGTHAEKRTLAQLRAYFERIVKMQDQESNLVYVVALAGGTPEWSTLSWIDMVEKRGRYFHPVGTNGWPKAPPNYIGFRYRGQLRSIHHIDEWKIVTDFHSEMPELMPEERPPHFLYTLGPAILPTKTVKNGRVYPNGRVWAMLDLLLTCDTVSDARDKTKSRRPDE